MQHGKLAKFAFIRRHKILTIIVSIIVVILVVVFYPKTPKPVETQVVKRQDILQTLSATGKIDSQNIANLTFSIGGKLIYLSTKEGDHVQQGQTIAMLDERTTQKNLETALRNYSEQRNSFDQTIDNNQGRTPDQAINTQMKRILQDNQYDLEKAVLSVELQSLAKEQSVLTSPISGIIIRQDVDTVGANITSAATFTVADPDSLIFRMDVDEADIGNIRQDQPLNLSLDAFPDRTFTLRVSKIAFATHTTDTGGDAYTVEAELPNNNDLDYRIGMNGDAEIILAQKKNVLSVPLASLTDDNSVYVRIGNNKFRRQKLQLGIQNDTDAEVLSGLNPGEQVAIQPSDVEKTLNKKTKFPF